MKWVYAAAGLGLVGYAVWQFLAESAKVGRNPRPGRWEAT